jgi:hypothetical protein
VVGVPDVAAALRVLDVGVQDSPAVFGAHRSGQGRPALGVVRASGDPAVGLSGTP